MTEEEQYSSAIDELTVAIEAFIHKIGEGEPDDGAVLSGFVLSYQEQRFNTNLPAGISPVQTSIDYAMGQGTTGETALGLLRLNQLRIERDILDSEEDDDD